MKELTGVPLRFFTPVKRRLSIAICCIPVLVVGIFVAVGAFFVRNGRVLTMDVNTIFLLVMGLACPIGMGLMMWLMNKNVSHQPSQLALDKQKPISAADRLDALREQRQILEAEIAEMTRIAELEEQHKLLLPDPSSTSTDTPISAAY